MRHFIALGAVAGALAAFGLVEACGGGGGSPDGGDASLSGDAASDSPFSSGDGPNGDGGACDPPDMLIVLDHTDSMSREPNGGKPPAGDAGLATSKWVLACDAVNAVVTPPRDQGLRFGLELFPLDPDVITDAGGTGHCQTLSALLSGSASTNTSCQPGEVLVSPSTGTGTQIQSLLDPYTLRLCISTPIDAALKTAQATLASVAVSGRKQFVILVTDGGETCVAGSQVTSTTQALAAAGIDTFVVGFGSADAGGGGVNVSLLNDLACAGMTAANFSTTCKKQGSGYVAITPGGPPLFYLAEDGTTLQTTLSSVTKSVCCGCVN